MPWYLDMPLGQALAVTRILDCVKGKTVAVADLPLGSDEEKLELTMALHSWGAPRHGLCRCGHQACVPFRLLLPV